MQRHVLAGGGFPALLALLVSSCGARTELTVPEACPSDGETRPCLDGCGSGVQSCRDGYWTSCQVAEAVRPCQNDCGSGTEACRDGRWSECEVRPVTRPCQDECGSGEESCVDGKWRACEVPPVRRPCESVCGPGNETCKDGKWGRCDAPLPKPPQLKATVRDFSPITHPDFEQNYEPGLDTGIVEPRLGADEKPVYAPAKASKSTSGQANFDKWYHDDPVNQSAPLALQLEPSSDDAALFVYENRAFFPIDEQLLGNEGRAHNFHFTLEAKTFFQYIGGEVFSFTGDDDMWVFVDHQLAIDLGGLHSSLSAEIALDDIADRFGLVRGETYDLHFFFAERHTVESNFTIRTSIAEPGSCK